VLRGVSLRVRPLTTRDPRGLLANKELDFAIGYFPVAVTAITQRAMQEGSPDAIEHQRLYGSEYVCVMRKGHPLGDGPMTLDTYCSARHLLVSFSGRPFGFVDEALGALKRRVAVDVYTDSEYVRRGITEWLPGWKARRWRTADKKPVKNQDLWEALDAAAAGHDIAWHWVPGHAGVDERADALANRGIDELADRLAVEGG